MTTALLGEVLGEVRSLEAVFVGVLGDMGSNKVVFGEIFGELEPDTTLIAIFDDVSLVLLCFPGEMRISGDEGPDTTLLGDTTLDMAGDVECEAVLAVVLGDVQSFAAVLVRVTDEEGSCAALALLEYSQCKKLLLE